MPYNNVNGRSYGASNNFVLNCQCCQKNGSSNETGSGEPGEPEGVSKVFLGSQLPFREASKSGWLRLWNQKIINQWEATINFTIGQLQCILASHWLIFFDVIICAATFTSFYRIQDARVTATSVMYCLKFNHDYTQ